MGLFLCYGLGFSCLQPAAEKYAEARLYTVLFCEAGYYGVDIDVSQAVQYYTQTYNSGSTLAAILLGFYLFVGS
jgi:TPR repeat protein